MTAILQIFRRALWIPVILAAAGLFGLMVLTFADVMLRSTFNAPIEAATELIRMAMAILVFAALPMLSWRDEHISVDLLDGVFQRFRLARVRDGLIQIVCGGILLFPAERIVVLAERARSYGDTTEYLSIPTFFIAWFIAIMTFAAAAVMILRGLVTLFRPSLLSEFSNK
ncbi:TRAP transporter small permease [Rhodosalinus sp.]|uniref:TRAP transporter small permease n=1 Tax=Rhodosalinus sp. TaxID=2047741 RepID=UPI003561FF80